MMRIGILCSDPDHPVNAWLQRWMAGQAGRHEIQLARSSAELRPGDFLFLVSCHEIVGAEVRKKFRFSLVLHASALPYGRGMSPHIWQIVAGRDRFSLTLLNAEDRLDEGDIWAQEEIVLNGSELYDEINDKLFAAELRLLDWALNHCEHAMPRKQAGAASYFRKRVPADSLIDPYRPIAEQFDLLRVADPERYPAFFELHGKKYKIRLERCEE